MIKCASAGCSKEATHTLHFNSLKHGFKNQVEYCLDDALYFYAWLMYCYPGKYEMLGITPPASELFRS